MSQLLPEFQAHKEHIPEFIVKLYHILEKKQYQDYLCWNGDDEILIKSGKKLQEKVLPHFFRHKHLSSFIRQLNMYKFSKVAKVTKQRNHMYFKNEYFQKGKIKQLMKIKRNNKKNRTTNQMYTPSKSIDDDQVSIMQQMSEDNTLLFNYKGQVRKSFQEIKEILSKVMQRFPETARQLGSAKLICDQVMEVEEKPYISQIQDDFPIDTFSADEFSKQNDNDIRNMLTTQKNIPKLDSSIFVSNISDFNLNCLN